MCVLPVRLLAVAVLLATPVHLFGTTEVKSIFLLNLDIEGHHVMLDLSTGRIVDVPKAALPANGVEEVVRLLGPVSALTFEPFGGEDGTALFFCSSGRMGVVRKADTGNMPGKLASELLAKAKDYLLKDVQSGDYLVVQTREGQTLVLAVGAFDRDGVNLSWFQLSAMDAPVTQEQMQSLSKEKERFDIERRQLEDPRKRRQREARSRPQTRPPPEDFVALAARCKDMSEPEFRDHVQHLLKAGASPNATLVTSPNSPPIVEAIRSGASLAMIKVLVESGADFRKGWALGSAAYHGRADVARYLLELGADIYQKGIDGDNVLQVALRSPNRNEELIFLLKERGAGLDLHTAVEAGDLETIRRLVKNGADVNAENSQGRTPLALAVEANSADTCRLLLELGANAGPRRRKATYAALNTAVSLKKLDVIPVLIPASPPPVLRVALLKAAVGGDVDVMNQILARLPAGPLAPFTEAETEEVDMAFRHAPGPALAVLETRGIELPLGAAARVGRHERIKALLAAGADINARDSWNNDATALFLAVQAGQRDMVELLLENKANPDIRWQNATNPTPLHEAVAKRDIEIVRLLLAHHAAPNELDTLHWPPLYYAVRAADEVLAVPDDPEASQEKRDAKAKAKQAKVDMVRALLEGGADSNLIVPMIDMKGNRPSVPLWKTAKSKELAALFAEHGAK